MEINIERTENSRCIINFEDSDFKDDSNLQLILGIVPSKRENPKAKAPKPAVPSKIPTKTSEGTETTRKIQSEPIPKRKPHLVPKNPDKK